VTPVINRRLPQQEQGRAYDIVHFAQSSKWKARGDLLADGVRLGGHSLGDDRRRRDGVNPYAEGAASAAACRVSDRSPDLAAA